MIVEILGAKLLAPYLGTSHFVWTAQIGVTLVALASGYALGGRLADRSTGLHTLYWALLLAAVYLGLSVWWVEPVAFWSLKFQQLPVGSLVTAMILYFPPLAMLAVTTPFLVRALTTSLQSVGASVGRLSALSTLGSVLGTVMIGYVLIPLLPNTRIMFFVSAVLIGLSAVYFLIWGQAGRGKALTVGVVGLGLSFYAAGQPLLRVPSGARELFRGNSNFGLLQVVEPGFSGLRYYLNDCLVQNTYRTTDHQSSSLFTYMLSGLARVYTPEIREVLCVGMGIGIVPMDFARAGARVDVVEINEAIVPVAEQYFDLDPTKLRITVGDGRHYLAVTTNRYDTIILDAFLGESVPSHLMSREALTVMKQRLRPDGTLVMNTFGDTTLGRDYFLASLYRTLRVVFREVRVHAMGNGNVFFLAGDREGLSALRPPDLSGVPGGLLGQVRGTYDTLMDLEGRKGDVLTDDFNPMDFYDAVNREKFRRMLALNAKVAGN